MEYHLTMGRQQPGKRRDNLGLIPRWTNEAFGYGIKGGTISKYRGPFGLLNRFYEYEKVPIPWRIHGKTGEVVPEIGGAKRGSHSSLNINHISGLLSGEPEFAFWDDFGCVWPLPLHVYGAFGDVDDEEDYEDYYDH